MLKIINYFNFLLLPTTLRKTNVNLLLRSVVVHKRKFGLTVAYYIFWLTRFLQFGLLGFPSILFIKTFLLTSKFLYKDFLLKPFINVNISPYQFFTYYSLLIWVMWWYFSCFSALHQLLWLNVVEVYYLLLCFCVSLKVHLCFTNIYNFV